MKKLILSVLGGILFGWLTTVLFMEYEAPKTSHIFSFNDGDTTDNSTVVAEVAPKTVNELDFNFVFTALALSIGGAIVIYLIWTYIDKKRHEKFLEEFHDRKRMEN